MNKILRLLILSSSVLFITGCISPKGKNSNNQSGDNSQASASIEPSSASKDSSEVIGESVEFKMSGDMLPFDNYGLNFDGKASEQDNVDKLVAAANESAKVTILSKLEMKKCSIQTDSGDASVNTQKEHLHFTIGTGSSEGSATFTFTKEFKKVVLKCSAYYKVPYTVDTGAMVYINGKEHDLETTESGEQTIQTFEETLDKATKELVLNNVDEDQRIFVESIQLYF